MISVYITLVHCRSEEYVLMSGEQENEVVQPSQALFFQSCPSRVRTWYTDPDFSVGNRVEDPIQKVGSSSPVVACKNMAIALLEGGMDVGSGGDSEELTL